jgi:hypothetical protein
MQKSFSIVIFVALIGVAFCGQYCFNKLTAAQSAFNQALGISANLDWNNVDSLWNLVQTHYYSDPPYGFRQVCSANKAFKSALMLDYLQCVRVIELIRNDDGTATNVSLINAMNYMALINSFDFTCGAGFGIFANTANCVSGIFQNSHEDLKRCRDNLNYQLLNGDPKMACTYVADSLNCTRTVFRPCGNMADYFGCEYARTPSISLFPHCSSVNTNCLVTNYL